MLNTFFLLLIVASLLYVLVASRKEVPLVIFLHALLQYSFTLTLWMFRLGEMLSGILLGFLLMSSFLLIWARSIDYSREIHSIRLFFTLCQWTLLLALVGFISWESPYYFAMPSSSWHPGLSSHQLSIHPALKLGGNFLIFTAFFQMILHWGQKWSPVKSFLDLGPIVLYIFLMGGLRYFLAFQSPFPFT